VKDVHRSDELREGDLAVAGVEEATSHGLLAEDVLGVSVGSLVARQLCLREGLSYCRYRNDQH
jgi:hypothetical protein